MKIKVLFILGVFILALTGCRKTEQDSLKVYSFNGENELFAISNGVIVLDDTEEIFTGGDLKVMNDNFTNIKSYSTTFYIKSGDEKEIILSNSATGIITEISGDLGQISSEDIFGMNKCSDTLDVQNNLYFELKTINEEGEEKIYTLQMSLTELTGNSNN